MRLQLGEPLARAHILPEATVELSADLAAICRRPQQRSERRFLAGLDACYVLGRHERDAGVRVARARAVADPAVLEREVTFGAVGRIGNQHEVRKPLAEANLPERRE